jgi:long-chain acyl-CoA synthetase
MSFANLLEAFLYQVEHRPDAVALLHESASGAIEPISWERLYSAVAHCAKLILQRCNETTPPRVGYRSTNSSSDVIIALACMSLGAIEVPIDARLAETEIRRRWNRVGGLWLEDDDFDVPMEAGQLPSVELQPDAPGLILWTSGTTSHPQGVTLSHRNLCGNAMAKLKAVPQTVDDVRLTVLPLSHAYARTCDLGTWLLSGCTLAVTLGFAGLQRLSPQVRPTLINMVPMMSDRLLEQGAPAEPGLDRLRLLGCGGAAMSVATFAAWQRRGVTVIQGYGLTETSPVICSATPENAAAGLVGTVVEGWEHQIRNGELFVRGPHVMLGYWNDASATQQKIDREGWLATKDIVEIDPASGQLRILGRVDDTIVLANGGKIQPQMIEREVQQIPGIDRVMLVWLNRLELWIDAESDCSTLFPAIESILRQQPNLGPCSIHQFSPPLSEAAGELTSKGTIRRSMIIKNRFRVG